MNKKIWFLLIIGILFLNIFSIQSFFFNVNGNNAFEEKKYIQAVNNFSKAHNEYGGYNEGNTLYKEQKYIDAIKKYVSILDDSESIFQSKILFNLGNSYYKIGEQETDISPKIQYWEKSLEYYQDSLHIYYDEKTKKNFEFVQEKLNALKKESEPEKPKNEQNQNGNEPETPSESGSESQSGTTQQTQSGSGSESQNGTTQQAQSGSGSESQNGTTQQAQSSNQISEEMQNEIQKYEEYLKQNQKDSKDFFNKPYQEESNDPFEQFFRDPFFDNSILNQNDTKKDW